jgi:hypothetical protein
VTAFDEWGGAGLAPEQKLVFWLMQGEPYGTGTAANVEADCHRPT